MNDVPLELLRDALRGTLTPAPAGGCIESEGLAAWSEGTLRARERDAIERHASECAPCQALLAAMARSAPPIPAARRWSLSGLGWLAPLAAAGAAILLWINVPRSSVDRSATSPATVTASAETPAGVAAALPTTSPAPQSTEPRAVEARRQPATRTPRRASPPAASQPAAQPDDRGAGAGAIGPMKSAPEPAGELPQESKSAPAEPILPGPPARAAAQAKFDGPDAAPSKFERPGEGTARPVASPAEIVSPDAAVRWRLLPGGRVARSLDRGATWQEQSTGVAVTLSAGAAPSPDVCWLVGPAGTILVTADGRAWQRVTFPEAIDLVSVRASDAANATVTSADGRSFSTADGGKRWRQP
jgi:hypothetical protein